MNFLAVVIARSGSRGIPGKNLALVDGEPLVAHIIKSALKASKYVPFEIILSTDAQDIRDAGVKAGAWAPFLRPRELAGDDIPSLPVVQHAVREAENQRGLRYDIIIYLQPTAPLCRSEDIVTCIEKLRQSPSAVSAVAVAEAETHPFRMKRMLDDGQLINYIDQGFEDMRPRQSLPKVYRRAGSVYVSHREVIMEKGTLVGDPCIGVEVPPETAVDVDTPIDLELVRLLYDRKNNQ